MSDDRDGPPKPCPARRLVRQVDPVRAGETVGYVRSTAAYRRIRHYLAGNVRIERESSGLRVYIESLHQGEQPYTSVALRVASLQEAFFRLAQSGLTPQPGDVLEIVDDAGTVLKIPLAEIHLSPRLDRLAADGQKRVSLSCGRCPRRDGYAIEELIKRLGGHTSLEALCTRWIEGCDRRNAGQYRQCRPKAEMPIGQRPVRQNPRSA